ncbi:MAG: hypothetical protein J6331_01745, partial [Lentisphaeria bacterium]|nr:hypothetical protein [Lentisphaeria bacterium]
REGHSKLIGLMFRAFRIVVYELSEVHLSVCHRVVYRQVSGAARFHEGSLLADIALKIPWAGRIWKPLHALKRSARQSIVKPELPALKIALIVSTNNAFLPGKLFFREEADGMVALSSALAPDAAGIAYTDASHVGMQFDERTAFLIRRFFLEGTF